MRGIIEVHDLSTGDVVGVSVGQVEFYKPTKDPLNNGADACQLRFRSVNYVEVKEPIGQVLAAAAKASQNLSRPVRAWEIVAS